jgi:hypothetical protein
MRLLRCAYSVRLRVLLVITQGQRLPAGADEASSSAKRIDSFLDELKSKQALRQTHTHKQTNKRTERCAQWCGLTRCCAVVCATAGPCVARMRVRCMLSRVVWYQYASCRMGQIRSGTNCPRRRRSTRTRTRPTCAFTFARLTTSAHFPYTLRYIQRVPHCSVDRLLTGEVGARTN